MSTTYTRSCVFRQPTYLTLQIYTQKQSYLKLNRLVWIPSKCFPVRKIRHRVWYKIIITHFFHRPSKEIVTEFKKKKEKEIHKHFFFLCSDQVC